MRKCSYSRKEVRESGHTTMSVDKTTGSCYVWGLSVGTQVWGVASVSSLDDVAPPGSALPKLHVGIWLSWVA